MEKGALLAEIERKVALCQRCDLWKGTKHSVPGEGNPEAKVVFIGEAPGFYEDQIGKPFVGAAGKLLESTLAEIGINRTDVFIANVVKHRPPENRDPAPNEIAACSLWLDQQLEVINPRVIVTLGRYSLARYSKAKISAVHGQPQKVAKRWVLPMFHPAAALRAGSVFEAFKKDFQDNKDLLTNPDSAEVLLKDANSEEEDDSQLDLF